MAETTDAETRLAKMEKIASILSVAASVAITLWWVWDMESDDPLGLPAQVRRWWAARRVVAARRRREALEIAELAIDIDLFLLREIERWKHVG